MVSSKVGVTKKIREKILLDYHKFTRETELTEEVEFSYKKKHKNQLQATNEIIISLQFISTH